MLNIIYGANNTNRDELFYDFLAKSAKHSSPSWILVPEQFSLTTEKYIIDRFGIASQKNIKVITFSRLCNLVLSKKGPLRMQYIDGAGKQILAARTLRMLDGRLANLAPNLKRKGFSSTLVSLVSEFKRYGVTPDQLSEASKSQTYPDFNEKLADLTLLYETYNSFLEKHASDAEDNLELIYPKLKDCDFLCGSLFISHFRSFTPVEYRVIEQLLQRMDIYASMCCDDIYQSSSLFSPIAHTCLDLISFAEASGISHREIPASKNASEVSPLSHLQDNYFKTRPVPYSKKTDAVNIFELSGNYREIETAADLILNLCRTENRRFSDFLVLARTPETYNRIMPAIFKSRGIDVFLDTRRSILTKPFTEMLCSVLDVVSYGYSYDRVMTIARSGMLNISDEDIDIFENYLLLVNPTHAMWELPVWEYCPKGYDIDIVNQVRAAVSQMIDFLRSSLSGRKSAKQICDAIFKMLSDAGMAEKTEEICNRFTEQNMPYLADEYRQVLNSVISVLSQISALMDDENITWQDFAELFKNACSGISVGLTPQTQGSVTFSPIDKFRSSGTKIVIVLGMTDGVFPLAHTSEGLLSDAERLELLKSGIHLAPTADAKRHEEQLLIYSVLSAPTDNLYLFSPLFSADGKPLEPSSIIRKVRQLFPNIEVFNPDCSDDYLSFTEGQRSAFEVLCSSLAEAQGDIDKLCPCGKALYEYFSKVPEYCDELSQIVSLITSPTLEKLSKDTVTAIYGKTIMLSASKLEKYNACAFSYFMNYGLLAAEREMSKIESKSTGTIQHEALYKYFSGLKRNNIDYSSITKDDCYREIYSIVKDEAIKSTELLYESSSYYKYVVTRMQGIAARTAWEVVKFYKSSLFRPLGFEIKINTDGEIPSLDVKNDDGTKIATITGMIDRADTAVLNGKTYVSIIDYKSSQKSLDERLTEAGVHLQPLLYSDIVCRRLEASPAAMLYMQMTDPIVDEARLKAVTYEEVERATNAKVSLGGWLSDNADVVSGYSSGGENGEKFIPSGKSALVSESELKRRIEQANIKIKESALGIQSGNVEAKPYSDKGFDACQYCPYGTSCRHNM